jgi:hypothetical protein
MTSQGTYTKDPSVSPGIKNETYMWYQGSSKGNYLLTSCIPTETAPTSIMTDKRGCQKGSSADLKFPWLVKNQV